MEREKTHPILIAAGAGVLLFSLLGAAALTGIMPVGNTRTAELDAVPQKPSAAATTPTPAARPAHKTVAAGAACAGCGKVESIRAVEVQGEASGVGAVAGGVLGGVVGNQFGHGGTRTVLTVGGAAGGALAGNAIEKNMKKRTVWRVAVRLDDGTLRTVSQQAQPPFAVGDRVRLVDGNGIERV